MLRISLIYVIVVWLLFNQYELCNSTSTVPSLTMVVPSFITGLKPQRQHWEGRPGPLWECIHEVTWIQWAQFFSG